jgi:ketosteroid isomerase-like protein
VVATGVRRAARAGRPAGRGRAEAGRDDDHPVAAALRARAILDDRNADRRRADAAQVRLSTSLADSGDIYENVYVYFFRFADGKIAEVWEHLDTAYAFALFDRALGKQ